MSKFYKKAYSAIASSLKGRLAVKFLLLGLAALMVGNAGFISNVPFGNKAMVIAGVILIIQAILLGFKQSQQGSSQTEKTDRQQP